MTDVCPLCESADTSVFFRSSFEMSVRSDWSIVPVPAEVHFCAGCGLFHKPSEYVEAWANYHDYELCQAGQRVERQGFDLEYPALRSAVILNYLQAKGLISEHSRVLDMGCNRGNFLALLEVGRHAGYDLDPDYAAHVNALGFDYHTPWNKPPKTQFSLLTLIHVLEHLVEPAFSLGPILECLKPDARVLIQVPDSTKQPTDFYVADHCRHFSSARLNQTMADLGYYPDVCPHELLSGEWTAVYRAGTATLACKSIDDYAGFMRAREVLEAGENLLMQIKDLGRPILVFGAGYLGCLIREILGDLVVAFIDDNLYLQGQDLMGVPVYGLQQTLGFDEPVVIAVPPVSALRVAGRCRAANKDLYLVYPLAEQLDSIGAYFKHSESSRIRGNYISLEEKNEVWQGVSIINPNSEVGL